MSAMKLYYFDLTGRGETARLLLTLGGIEFEDVTFSHAEWPSYKDRMPFGQVPVLEADGKMLPQMAAIDRYCATLTGMLPEGDPLEVAQAEALYFFMEDVWQPAQEAVRAHMSDASPDAKAAAWKALLAPERPFKTRLGLLDKALADRHGGFIATGDKLTFIDLFVFVVLCMIRSGFLEGVPRDLLSAYPAITAFRHKVASQPGVAAFYAKATDEQRVNGFRPDKE